MTALRHLIHSIALAAVAGATLAAAGAASASPVEMTRPECIKGFWHERTYDISNPDKWVLIEDKATEQRCSVPQPPVPGAESANSTPQLNASYRFQPTYELRPTLRYQFEERWMEQQRPTQPFRISPRYAF